MRIVSLLFCLFIFGFKPCASAHNGTINGQVLEQQSGLELPGALVRLEPLGLSAGTNDLGFFLFQQLPAGIYSLTVSYLGYEAKTLTAIQVRDGETTTVRLELSPAPIALKDVEVRTPAGQPFQYFSALDIRTRPVNSTQEILRMVPGLFIAQHAGGGKAEQIFLRGFDIDHGTDIQLSVDGMPVNMVSHAHGQGYADLHFVIPEVIEQIDFKKGPYTANAGDFATAGTVSFRTMDAPGGNSLKVEGGQFNTARAVGIFNLLGKSAERRNRHAYVAAETFYSDGYFQAPQAFRRMNLMGKYTALIDDAQRVSLFASAFQSDWDASGQIPERAVSSGQISRFGAIDSTEGGITGRYNLNFEYLKNLRNNAIFKHQLYYSRYQFELYSNFTFFKNDPVNGDQIRQKEDRHLVGYHGVFQREQTLAGKKLTSEIGLFFRNDRVIGNELSRTKQRRQTLSRLAFGDINQTNTGLYTSETWQLSEQFSINAGLRYDLFQFSYEDQLDSIYQRVQIKQGVASPKLNLHYTWSDKIKLYCSAGYGFHSNDTRVVVPQNGLQTLPQALGSDLGIILKPTPTLLIQAAAWYLALEQEFVYVGDEAVVEAGGRTRRFGLDLSARLQLGRFLFADADFTYTHARAIDDPEGANFIPLAPVATTSGGLNWDRGQGFFANLRFRHLADRPANPDNSLIAEGFFLLDAMTGFRKHRWEVNLSIQNIGNTAWKEAQFETETQLPGELSPVTEIHFTPGTPFFLKGGLLFKF